MDTNRRLARIAELRRERAEIEHELGESVVPCDYPPAQPATTLHNRLLLIDAEIAALIEQEWATA